MLWEYIKSDLYRYEGKLGWKSFFKHYYITPGFKYCFYLRICRKLKSTNKGLYIIFRLVLRHYSFKFGYDIPVDTKIGYGFYIGHFGGVVISSNAIIGNNCNISQGITIGYSSRGKNVGHPTIGDNVYIGPNAVIIGNIIINNNVAIGANAVITKDCEENTVLAGVPAKVLSNIGSEGYILNMWPKKDK
jgi:serine O-acetyltransferase